MNMTKANGYFEHTKRVFPAFFLHYYSLAFHSHKSLTHNDRKKSGSVVQKLAMISILICKCAFPLWIKSLLISSL